MELLNFDDTGYGDELLAGLWVTVRLAVSSFVLSLVLGVIIGLVAVSRNRLVQGGWRAYASLFMGVPSILVVFFVYYNLPVFLKSAFDLRIDVSPFLAGLTALAVVYAAYVAEVVRGAVLNIPQGQFDAARALGLGKLHMWWLVILPLVWRIALPGLTNVWMTVLKDTALVSLVGLNDLVRTADVAAAVTRKPFLFYVVVALVFIAFAGVTGASAKKIEQRVNLGQERSKGF